MSILKGVWFTGMSLYEFLMMCSSFMLRKLFVVYFVHYILGDQKRTIVSNIKTEKAATDF